VWEEFLKRKTHRYYWYNGKECVLIKHMGDASSAHNYSVKCFTNLKNTMAQIDNHILNKKENGCIRKTKACDFN
jgi:hypothetical protein